MEGQWDSMRSSRGWGFLMRINRHDLFTSIFGSGRYIRTNLALIIWALSCIGIAGSVLAGKRLSLEIFGGIWLFATGFLIADLIG